MNWLNNIKTGVKLIGSFSLIAAILVVMAVVSFFNMKSIDDGMSTLYLDRTLPIEDLGAANEELYSMRGDVFKFVLIPGEQALTQKSLTTSISEVNRLITKYRSTKLVKAEEDGLVAFDAAWASYQKNALATLDLAKAGKEQEAIQQLVDGGATANARKAVDAAISHLITINSDLAKEIDAQGDVTFTSAWQLLLFLGVTAVAAALIIGVLISRSITTPLAFMAAALQNIGKGDLNRKTDQSLRQAVINRKDEFGLAGQGLAETENYLQGLAKTAASLATGDLTVSVTKKCDTDELGISFAEMVASLRSQVSQIAENADALNTASAELASAADQAGRATSQIAATVQQVAKGISQESESVSRTATSVEQMSRAIDGVAKGAQEQTHSVSKAAEITADISKTIQQVAGNAQSVTRDSANAAEAARVGAQTVTDTVKGMERIKAKVSLSAQRVTEMGARSEQIGMIVETIEDIASQTNLLALNAAIEAARAGEHGKGFAVVADEVRKLAERSSSATKEIGGLIKGIQKTVSEAVKAMEEGGQEVESGVKLANEAGEALAEILKAAEAVYQQAEAANKGTLQMTTASGLLVSAVDGVSAVVEENTAATEEMAAGTSEVTRAIENIAAVSEQNSAAVEQVSASAEEMSAQVEEVTASAQSLAEMARALQEVVAQFTLDDASLVGRGSKKAPVKTNGQGPTARTAAHNPSNGKTREKAVSFSKN